MVTKAIMVDVDGVLIHGRPEDGRPWSTCLEVDLGISAEDLHREFFAVHWNEIIVGHAMLEDRLSLALQIIAPHLTVDRLISYWFAKDTRLDKELLRDLTQLRSSGFQLHLATNQEHLRAKYLLDELGLAKYFDSIQYSAQIGAKKPELEFFRSAALRTSLSPDEILLIDDVADNVEGARRAGWRAVLWTAEKPISEIIKDLV